MKLFISLLLLPLSAFARLGETREQCIQRYGAAHWVDKEKTQASFVKDGLVISALFVDGKCVILEFKWPENATGVSVQRSELAHKSLGSSIQLIFEDDDGRRVWETRNKARCAVELSDRRLMIALQKYLDGQGMDRFKGF